MVSEIFWDNHINATEKQFTYFIYRVKEATTGGDLWKQKVFLEISQNWKENTSVRESFLIKLQTWGLQLY